MVDVNVVYEDMVNVLSHNTVDMETVRAILKVSEHVPDLLVEIEQLRKDLREMYELTKGQRQHGSTHKQTNS